MLFTVPKGVSKSDASIVYFPFGRLVSKEKESLL
jgi:hypothetical protein